MQSITKGLKHITRKSFNSTFDVNKARLKVSTTLDFQSNQTLVKDFLNIFAQYGLVLLECDNDHINTEQTLEDNMLNLQYLFGSISHYDKWNRYLFGSISHYDRCGFFHIDSRAPDSVIDIATETFPIHTDGSYKKTAEKIQSLGCVIPAQPSGGGKSIFISGSYLMEYIYALCDENNIFFDGLKTLFKDNCMVMTKAIDEQYRQSEKGVLKYNQFTLDNQTKKVIELCFPPAGQMYPNENVQKLWSKIEDFVLDPVNQVMCQLQPNEICVADNYSILHSRSPFDPTEVRAMKRLNFEDDENGAFYQCLQHGMDVNEKYLIDNGQI